MYKNSNRHNENIADYRNDREGGSIMSFKNDRDGGSAIADIDH